MSKYLQKDFCMWSQMCFRPTCNQTCRNAAPDWIKLPALAMTATFDLFRWHHSEFFNGKSSGPVAAHDQRYHA